MAMCVDDTGMNSPPRRFEWQTGRLWWVGIACWLEGIGRRLGYFASEFSQARPCLGRKTTIFDGKLQDDWSECRSIRETG
jgi:hypothetical protein